MVGSSIWRILWAKGNTNLTGVSCAKLDLRNQQAVEEYFAAVRATVVTDVATKVDL
jgi:GDP-L-fucose synthase